MDNLLSDGLELMVFGMGFVAVFLTVLVFATTGMSAVVGKYFPEEPAQPKAKKKAAPAADNDDELVAVMTAAVHKYRS
ncbi:MULTISPECIES: OadG family transporter subunit [unclassified Neptuniibacter]|uniref:OadG family protein n=1 Tax=unclassified Neptuniibacter TaxID=2630693 RepID=UPI000C4A3AAB|nr:MULTISPECIES: OadG family transporter subunit [unclassified Neptuniibacter]MAY41733.1 oxaloacetate decarboxylase [Oceanospirillaceae bacterium]|tara:strand:- start:9869 stop:10102 length:234 start_codon:yes stop_codon:yes gene_type:complete